MSAATQSAATGAASGAAAGSVLGPWGTVAGGVIGGASGYLSGMGADKRAEAERAARRRLRQAMQAYSGGTQALADATVQGARGIDRSWQEALSQHLAGYPDLAAQLPGRIAQEQTALSGATAPALTPLRGRTGAQNQYLASLMADRNRRVSDATAPLAFEGGAARSQMAGQDYTRALATRLAELGMQGTRLGRLQQLQQAQLYEPLARAQAGYGVDRARAATAGSSQMLAGGLTQAGGNLLASYMMGQQMQPRTAVA